MDRSAPIGFFDSGLGGLSILRTARKLLPHENICYYGDSGNAPYGVREHEDLLRLSRAGAAFLMARGIKALVIACNTATGHALEALKAELPIPVFGVQPALEAAQKLRKGGRILAIATPATFKTERYRQSAAKHGEGLITLPCPGLMEFVERLELSGPRLHAFLADLFAPYLDEKIDVVVLGCTHYPFLWEAIRPFFPDAVAIDDGPRVSEELRAALEARHLLNDSREPGKVALYSSGGDEAVKLMRQLLEQG